MSKLVWALLIIISLDISMATFLGGPAYIPYLIDSYSLEGFGSYFLLFASVFVFFWGLFRVFRGGDRTQGFIAMGTILIANILLGNKDYSNLFSLFGDFKNNFWWYISAIIFFLVFGGWQIVSGMWKKAEGKPKEEKEKEKTARAGMLSEGVTRAWVYMLRRAKRNRLLARPISNLAGWGYPDVPGELSFALKHLRLEIYTLMNMALRQEIFQAKGAVATSLVPLFREKETFLQTVLIEEDEESAELNEVDLNKAMKTRIEGDPIKWNEEQKKWELTELKRWGFANKELLIYELMTRLRDQLEGNLTRTSSDPNSKEYADAVQTYVNTEKAKLIDANMPAIELAYDRYKTAVDRFKIFNSVRAYRLYFLDMYNMQGKYLRGYGFVRPGTEERPVQPYLCTYEPKSDDGIQRTIDWSKVEVEKDVAGNPIMGNAVTTIGPGGGYFEEVNLFGYSVSDINTIQMERGVPPNNRIRKFRKEDITYYPTTRQRFSDVLTYSEREWGLFNRDFAEGRFHPYSKSFKDYQTAIEKGHLKFDRFLLMRGVQFNRLLNPATDTGFDLEGLKNPGIFIYWGRKNYYDEQDSSVISYPANPYPALSFLGLWAFIREMGKKHSSDIVYVRRFINEYFAMQYGPLAVAAEEGGGQRG